MVAERKNVAKNKPVGVSFDPDLAIMYKRYKIWNNIGRK